MQVRGEALVAEVPRQPLHIVAQPRSDKGVKQSRRKPFELAELRRDLGRGASEALREFFLHYLPCPRLMRGVQIREQEADCDRLDPLGAQRPSRLAHPFLVEWNQFFPARRRQAFGDRPAMTASDQWPILPRNFLADRIVLRALVASDVDDIAIAGSRNHAGHRPVMLQHCIGTDRRAVQYMVDCRARQVETRTQLANSGDHAARRVVSCRRRFVDQGPAGFRVGKNDVREGAADIDADQVHIALIQPCRHPSRTCRDFGALQ